MTEASHAADHPPDPAAADPLGEGVWPSADYHRQVERRRAAVGETIYLVELIDSAVTLGVHMSGTPFELLGVIAFPRPRSLPRTAGWCSANALVIRRPA